MNKQVAAIVTLGIAGAIITCLFAYMLLQTNANAWGWASLISGFSTVWGLFRATKPEANTQSQQPKTPQF